ncbi:hypothetical protein PIROE2DRAFT_11776, partial [Piromyces sp. E2]
MSNGQMVIGIVGSIIPMNYYNEYGELTGFEYDFANELCSRLGIDPLFRIIDWDKKEKELQNKTIDCIWNSLTITEQRRKNMAFTIPYVNNKQVIVINKSNASKYTNIKSLKSAKFTALIGSTNEATIKSNKFLSQAKYEPSDTIEQTFENLRQGKCDAIVSDYVIAKSTIAKSIYSDLMIIKGIDIGHEEFGIGFRLNSDMTEKINFIIMDMMVDNTLATIAKKYDLTELYVSAIKTDSNYIMNKKELIIGIVDDRIPMNYYNNTSELIGFDTEFAKAVCQKLNITPKFKNIDWANKEFELKSRNIDCIWSSLSVTEQRRSTMKFSRIYMTNKQSIIIRNSDKSKYINLYSLADSGVKISAVISSTGEEVIKSNPYLINANLIESSTIEEMLIELKKGTYDAIVMDYTLAKANVESGEYSDLMIIPDIDLANETYAIGFRVGSDMTVKINEKIKELIADNTLLNLAKKYGLTDLYESVETVTGISDAAYIMGNGEIVIGIKENNKPFSYEEEGVLIGFDVELTSTLYKNLGIDVKYVVLKDWSKKEEKLISKEIDCIMNGIMNTSDLTKNVKFGGVIINNKQAVIIHRSNQLRYPNLESLSGSKIAAIKDSTGAKVSKDNAFLKKAALTEINSQENIMDLLVKGTYDAIILDYLNAKNSIATGNYSNLVILEIIDATYQEYGYSYRSGSDMVKITNKENMKMISDGSYNNIVMNYPDLIDVFNLLDSRDYLNVIASGRMNIGISIKEPLNYINNKNELIGFDTEFANEVSKRLGVEPVFHIINWNEKENELLLKDVDCIWSGLTVTEERREKMKFSRVYVHNRRVALIHKSDANKYKNIESLSKAKLSAVIGSTGEQAIKSNSYLKKANYIGSVSNTEAINQLNKGKYDAVIIDYSIAKSATKNKEYADLMIVDNLDLGDDEYAVGFRINSDLTVKINEIIQDLFEEKWINNIADKYGMSDVLFKNTDSDAKYIMNNGQIVIGIEGSIIPMSYYNEYGELTGFDYDFANEVCSRLGIDPIFRVIDWDKKEKELQNKTIDCIWNSLTITEQRRKSMKFSIPYVTNKQAIVINKSNASKYTNLESLKSAKITALIGSSNEAIIKSNKYLSQAKYEASGTIELSFENLKQGKFDATVTDF